MKKETIEKGYAAFAPDGRMLRNEWVGGGQTGTNRQTLTTNIEKVSLAHSLEEVKMFINWYNSNHKNQVIFTIKEVTRKTTIEFILRRVIKMTKYEDKIEQIKDIIDNYDLDELVSCCSYLDGDDAIYSMDDFDELLCGREPWDIARMAYYGEFCPTDSYFRFNVYGNLESTDNPMREGWIDTDTLAEYAVDYDIDFGDDGIQALLAQWGEEKENNEEVAE